MVAAFFRDGVVALFALVQTLPLVTPFTHLIGQLGRQHVPELEGELSVSFDPSWNEFLSLYAAIHRNDRPEEVLAS